MSSTLLQPSPRRFSDLPFVGRSLVLLAKGLLTQLPGMQSLFCRAQPGGATHSGSYCYGVWLKHLVLLWKHGMRRIPGTVVELGPGASLGTGFAALLSGAERYIGIDAVRHADAFNQRAILRELIELFVARAQRPTKGWPDYDDCLNASLFPGQILTEERLSRSLAPERLQMLERTAAALGADAEAAVRYASWDEGSPLGEGEADLVFSHVVLSLVNDLEGTYRHCARWLKPGAWMSHQISLTCHNLLPDWNGHLRYGERIWRRMAGRRPFFVRQERLSRHLELMRAHGLEPISVIRDMSFDGLPRSLLARQWRGLSDMDLHCRGAFVIARKVGEDFKIARST
jgi:hypothetical protein